MVDEKILELFWDRNEQAIMETQLKYGKYCYMIAYHILRDFEDAKECENDTYFSAWNVIPPQKPMKLQAFLGKITRNLSLKKIRGKTAEKRGGGEATLSLDELCDCISDSHDFQENLQAEELAEILNAFLRNLPQTERRIFLCRYWYCDSITEICKQFGFGQSKVKMTLSRTRQKLLKYLEKEGVFL